MNVKNPKLFCSVFSNQHMKEFERIYLPAWTSLWGEPTDGWKQVSLPSRTVRVLSRPAWKQPDLQQLWEPSPAIPMGFCPLDHLVPGDWATLTSSCEVSQSLMSNWRLDMGLSHRLLQNLPGAGLPGGVSEWVQSLFRAVAGSTPPAFLFQSWSALPCHITSLCCKSLMPSVPTLQETPRRQYSSFCPQPFQKENPSLTLVWGICLAWGVVQQIIGRQQISSARGNPASLYTTSFLVTKPWVSGQRESINNINRAGKQQLYLRRSHKLQTAEINLNSY